MRIKFRVVVDQRQNPFSYSQVQDVGLIFLSAMATAIADSGLDKHESKADILGTTLVTLTLSTLVVGFLIILVGQPQLLRSSVPSSPFRRISL